MSTHGKGSMVVTITRSAALFRTESMANTNEGAESLALFTMSGRERLVPELYLLSHCI